jgi:hypothetical protein
MPDGAGFRRTAGWSTVETWRILFTDYRRPRKTFPQTIKVVAALD